MPVRKVARLQKITPAAMMRVQQAEVGAREPELVAEQRHQRRHHQPVGEVDKIDESEYGEYAHLVAVKQMRRGIHQCCLSGGPFSGVRPRPSSGAALYL